MATPNTLTTDSAGTLGGDTVKDVYDTEVLRAFRAANVYRRLASVKHVDGDPMRGKSAVFTILGALAPATSALSESAEPTPVQITDSQVTINLVEQGNAFMPSRKVRRTSFVNMDLEAPVEIAKNMEESMDIVARNVLVAGTNVRYSGFGAGHVARNTQAATDTFKANDIRYANAFLQGKNTPYIAGMSDYLAIAHPDVLYDLQVESGQQAWSAPHVYSDPEAMYSGEIGRLDGVRVVSNSNARIFADAGNPGTVDVYATLFFGVQALGEVVGDPQHVVVQGPFDNLARFISVGWYALMGYGIVRQNSLLRVESASSIGAN